MADILRDYQDFVQGAREPEIDESLLWIDNDKWTEDQIPARPWLCEGYLMRGSLTIISGPGAAGKSSLMVAWSVALALGRKFNRFDPDTAYKVMLYNVEDDRDEQRRRLAASFRYFGTSISELNGNLKVMGPTGIGTLINLDAYSCRTSFTNIMATIEGHIAFERPDVVVFDPLVELHNAPENGNEQMRAVMAEFRRLAAKYRIAIIILHHTGKAAGNTTADDVHKSRGASSIPAAARINFNIATMSETDAKAVGIAVDRRRHYFRLDGSKINAALLEDVEWFELNSYELMNGDKVAAAVPWIPPKDVLTVEKAMDIEQGIEVASSAGEPWSPRLSNDPRSIKRLFSDCGITTTDGQKKMLIDLETRGYTIQLYRRPSNRVEAKGIRAPNGLPAANWIEQGTL